MEVDGLGARCALPTCNTLDYLPFTCPHCTLSFCADHNTAAAHRCPRQPASVNVVPVCPLCAAPVPVPSVSTPDEAVSRHIAQGCRKRLRTIAACAHPPCSVRDLAATKCPTCARIFCLAHRLEADHSCVTRPPVSHASGPLSAAFAAAAARTAQPVQRNRSPRAARVRRLARPQPHTTNFSNTPATALGDPKLPVRERITVSVFFPAGSNVQPRYMYFSHRSSAGRIIDGLVRDVRGLPQSPEGGRYCLYAVKSGGGGVNLLPHITPLRDLGADVVQDGDILVLEAGADGLHPDWITLLQKPAATSKLPSRRSFRTSKPGKCAVA